MAKRRKEKDEEEDKPFKIPKFDEKEFIRKEKINIKSTVISFLFGILLAIICFGFWALMGQNELRWYLVLLVAVFNASFLRYIYIRLNIDTKDFTKKNWFSSYAIYFFSWLIVLIVLVNPPFYDGEPPRIELIKLPGYQEPGGDVMIYAKITDNTGIDKSNIDFQLTYPDGTSTNPDFTYENNVFEYRFDYDKDGPNNFTDDISYDFSLSVTDDSTHSSKIEDSFTYSKNTITIPDPLGVTTSPGPKIGYAQTIKIDVDTQVNRVYYTVNGGNEINATLDDDGYYISSAKMKGWPKDQNVTINVTAELIYYFENHIVDNEFVKYTNTINDTQTYYFSVTDDPNVATEDIPEIKLPGPRIKQAPGFELLAFIASLAAVVLIFKYKKKNRSNQK